MGLKFLEAVFLRRWVHTIMPTHRAKIMAADTTIIINKNVDLKVRKPPSIITAVAVVVKWVETDSSSELIDG